MITRAARKQSKPADLSQRPPVELTDPRAIRALAHPARLAVIDEVYSGRELTATECAEIAGLSPSAMSYHLRSLERAGILERAESSGDGRERPWRAAGAYLRVSSGLGSGQRAAAAALSETVMGRTVEEFNRWIAARDRESQEWIDASGASTGQVWLSPEEAELTQQRMAAELEAFRSRPAGERPQGARRVRVAVLLFPLVDRKAPRAPS